MINIILEGYYSPAINFKEHLIREMNKSELSKLEFKNSLLIAVGSLKNKIEENFYKMLPLNNDLDIFKISLPLLFINSDYRGHISYKVLIEIEEVINSLIVAKTEIKEATFFDYIHNVINKELFAIDLKSTFNIETGIDFKIMIELLKEDGILSYTNFAPFFRSIKIYFDRNIGSQNGLNDLYKHSKDDQEIHADRIATMRSKLNTLITNHKIKS
jgi:hypothetical protein